MTFHAATFGIYVLISVVSGLFDVFEYLGYVSSACYDLSLILMTLCTSLTQFMICYIFWNIDNIRFVPIPKEEVDGEIQVERTDSEFNLQLRMWQQFIKKSASSVFLST